METCSMTGQEIGPGETVTINQINQFRVQPTPEMIETFCRKKGETMKAFIKRCRNSPYITREYVKALEAQLPVTEQEVQGEIWEFLERVGMFPIKFESQGTFDPRTGMRRKIIGGTKRKGVSDLFFTVGGRLRVCEVKTPECYGYLMRNWDAIRAHVPKPIPVRVKGEPKPKKVDDQKQRYKEQIEFIEKMTSLGHGGFFADSVQRVCLELLKEPHLLSSLQAQECSRLAAL